METTINNDNANQAQSFQTHSNRNLLNGIETILNNQERGSELDKAPVRSIEGLADAMNALNLDKEKPDITTSSYSLSPQVDDFSHSPQRIMKQEPLIETDSRISKRPRTAFYFHDDCFSHTYIRDKNTSDIVECPERLRAVKVGAAAMYTAQQASGIMPFDVVCCTNMSTVLEADPDLRVIHGQDWPVSFCSLARESKKNIKNGGSEIPSHLSQGDLYLSPGSANAVAACLGATYSAIDDLMQDKHDSIMVSLRPPGHHCGKDSPSGFCFFNNVVVTLQYAFRVHNITRAVILDIDLHHGNGTQSIVWNLNSQRQMALAGAKAAASSTPSSSSISFPNVSSPEIMYASLHDVLSYPCEDGDPSLIRDASTRISGDHGQWIWNVHLQEYSTFDEFLEIYHKEYCGILEQAEKFLSRALDDGGKSIIVISAGFDASEHEYPSMQRHGRRLPTQFYTMFSRDVRKRLADKYCDGKILAVLEGGYSDRALMTGVGSLLRGLSQNDEDINFDWELDMTTVHALEKSILLKKSRAKNSISLAINSQIANFVDETRKHVDTLFHFSDMNKVTLPNTAPSLIMQTRLRTRKANKHDDNDQKNLATLKTSQILMATTRAKSAHTTPVSQQKKVVTPSSEPVKYVTSPASEPVKYVTSISSNQDKSQSESVTSDDEDEDKTWQPDTPTPFAK